MATDAELVERLRQLLRTSDLNTTTTAIVRRRLEEDFGIDLTHKKAFIREQVDLFLQGQDEGDKADEEAPGDEEGDENGDSDGGGDEVNGEEEDEEEDENEEEEEEVGGRRSGRNKRSVKKKV